MVGRRKVASAALFIGLLGAVVSAPWAVGSASAQVPQDVEAAFESDPFR